MTGIGSGECIVASRPHLAAVGAMICRRHLEQIGIWLREIEDETCLLDARPSLAIRLDGGHASLASEQAPVRLNVLVHTDHRRGTGKSETDDDAHAAGDTLPILDVLHSWARIVREERHLATPRRITVSGERDLLTRQLEWIAEQPWVDEMFGEVKKLVAQLKRVNGTADLPVGKCSTLYDGEECGGHIRNVELQHDDGSTEPGFRCDRCRRVWTGTEAVRLRNALWVDEQAKKASA